jgi:hypothetical protein
MRKPLSPWSAVLFLGFALATSTGCATVFRSGTVKVHVESDPSGAQARLGQSETKATPADIETDRSSTAAIVVNKQGYAEHRGLVKKKLSIGWLIADVSSCVWALCIPLLVDAISGAWLDVAPSYMAKLEQAIPGGTAPTGGTPTPTPTPTSVPENTSSLSESERKATARAAYIEGVAMQEKNDCAGAIPKFEVAQKMFSAPTHLVRIAQCQVAIGKLVEAQETYETLSRTTLAADAPPAFKQAQEEGRKELPALKPRIPTLKVQVSPNNPKGLIVLVNGSPMPNELVGIARPVNPGKYKLSAEASGMRAAPQEVELAEGANKTIDLTLKK